MLLRSALLSAALMLAFGAHAADWQADPAAFFEAAGVGVSSGVDFGLPGWVRLNFGCPRATLDAALERMARACAGGRSEGERLARG